MTDQVGFNDGVTAFKCGIIALWSILSFSQANIWTCF